ncbi:MAG: protein kinase [Fimbriimonadaceae bacterium]|nr:protein kinase [Fimbriimonadaceae bacterium]
MVLRPGDLLEGQLETYLITATINRGAYGCAFRARTAAGDWRVVKQFAPAEELRDSDKSYQLRCFEREAALITTLRSPLLVRGHELIQRDDDRFVVMEHVQGTTLRQILEQTRLEQGRPFDAPTVVAIGEQLCAALELLHSHRIIYRDLKPANVMWDAAAQRLKLIDFGTAHDSSEGRGATQGLGTEGYAPPELYGSGLELTPATDVYTVGAVLYELSTAAPPVSRQTPTDFRGWEADLPLALRQAILRALAQAPLERYATAAELRAALTATVAAPASPPLRLRPRNQHPLLACYCPQCGREPSSDAALYCGADGALYQVAMVQIVPPHRPATTAYLDRAESLVGRADPEQQHFPEIDLSAADAGRHVSRRHATLRRVGRSFEVEIHRSLNPTRLDGQRVEPETVWELSPAQRLEFADVVVRLIVKPVVDEVER